MSSMKEKLVDLIDSLTDKQIEYIYHLVRSLFCHAPN